MTQTAPAAQYQMPSMSEFDLELEGLEFLDEDSINQQAYIESLHRDLSMGFPRYLEELIENLPID